LVEAVLDSNVAVLEHSEVLDVALWERATARQVTGVVVQRAGSSSIRVLSARAVILATGGVGAVFRASTNPTEVAGDGLAIALRAGATLVDLEFVQFHPTGLRVVGIGQVPLISEALRGEGAVLRDGDGTPIMAGHHPLADLAPRDVVARQIDSVMSGGDGGDAGFVGLDATAFGVDVMRERFPTAYSICRAHGIDPARELIPVAPVQHFMCGGIRTDSVGATDVPGLYAVGECAATGVHGANRLASNSLLEGMVFGARVARELTATLPSRREAMPVAGRRPVVPDAAVPEIRSTMSGQVGVRRSGPGLAAADVALRGLLQPAGSATSHRATNRWTVAAAIVAGATARRESRGCHWRADHPGTSAAWRHRVAVRLDESGLPVAEPDVALVRSA
jgi:L-aspartate oxidase